MMEKVVGSSGLGDALARCTTALNIIEGAKSAPSEDQAIEALVARDALQARLAAEACACESAPTVAEVMALDNRLRASGKIIAATLDLESLRRSLNPPAEAWWWAFEPPKVIDPWDRFDWLWNGLAAGALALAASFMVQIFQALSVGGLSWQETFATIAQGAGLAMIGSGALTDTGKQKVEEILNSLGISPKFHAEATLAFSVVLLITVFFIHSSLPDYYYKKGNQMYDQSNLTVAALKYQQGLRVAPDDIRFNLALGKVYESVGDLDMALREYKKGAETGDPEGLNNIGRVHIFRFDPVELRKKPELAEIFLRLGLQRAEAEEKKDDNLLYQLNRNLGWALLNQKKYEEAEIYLKNAIALDKKITKDQIGGGMAYCLLAHVYRAMETPEAARENWISCLERARPETVFEYKWFLDVGQGKLANCVDTTSIVAGISPELLEKFMKECEYRIDLSPLPDKQ